MKHSVTLIGFICISLLMSFCKQKKNSKELAQSSATSSTEKDSCDSPDAPIECYFVNMPKQLTSTMIIPDEKKDGEKLVISGTIYKKDKSPYANVILYAYHTDSKGEYSKKGNEKGVQRWHGSHHGWCKTDKNGNYKIETVRPASYPNSNNPQHIHAAVKLPNKEKPMYINDFLFKDDPLLNKPLTSYDREKGGSGVIEVKKVEGIWIGKRDIVLE